MEFQDGCWRKKKRGQHLLSSFQVILEHYLYNGCIVDDLMRREDDEKEEEEKEEE